MTVAQIRNGKTKMENHRQVPVINQACHKKLLTEKREFPPEFPSRSRKTNPFGSKGCGSTGKLPASIQRLG
jgi:hypothetical protein